MLTAATTEVSMDVQYHFFPSKFVVRVIISYLYVINK